jgi:hypothetical protein
MLLEKQNDTKIHDFLVQSHTSPSANRNDLFLRNLLSKSPSFIMSRGLKIFDVNVHMVRDASCLLIVLLFSTPLFVLFGSFVVFLVSQ